MNFKDLVNNAIAESIGNYSRQGGHYSITELSPSPRLTLLRRRHEKHRPHSTYENSFSSFKGNGIHNEMKRGLYSWKRKMQATDPEFAETIRVEYRVMDKVLGRRITGQPDLVVGNKLWDWKTKKAWSSAYVDGQLPKWEMQVNGYAYLLNEYNIEIKEAAIGAFYLDWNKFNAEKNPGKYPEEEIEEIPIRVWSYAEQKQFIEDSVNRLIMAESLDDDDLPECTEDDTWERTTYRLCKKGGKRAIRIYSNSAEAHAKKNSYKNSDDYFVLPVQSEPTFCRDYCWCRDYCNQWLSR